ncbi:MAG: HAMP domain-containing protein [Treponema sp.]|jgi:adenylate cyclase|nr:HAMP domain-containing protein [Treponema sp.]
MSEESTAKTTSDKIEYPIGAKLIIIITALLLVSLGAITVLVSILVSDDVRVTAEDNNFTVNRRSALEAENFLVTVRSNTLVLLDTLNAAGTSSPVAGLAADFFFERNKEIAFIGIGQNVRNNFALSRRLVNERFFFSNELEPGVIGDFINVEEDTLERCLSGETLLVNAAPVFGIPVLALIFPWQEAGRREAALVFFSSNTLTENFGGGANLSFMVNDTGDYLVHADYDLIRAGAGASSSPIVSMMLESTDQGYQTLFKDTDQNKHFGAFRKISLANAAVITTIPYDVVFEGIAATTRRNLYLTGAVLLIAILFVWFFSKTVSVPLKTLASSARQIEDGDFELHLVPKTKDEIGFLTKSFQRMSGALSIFGRFTNREIAVKAMRGEIKPGGLPKHATIFFSDIRGFTEKSENFTKKFGNEASDLIVHWLNEYFTRMVDCVEKTHGVVDKFIGDAVMAHWGTAYTSGSPQEDAFNCVASAMMMRQSLLEMNSGRGDGDPANPPIRIGCGINSGIVTAGQLGSEQRMEYTVIGDPVNLASRTEALNKPLGTDILITEDTWNLTGDRFITAEMPPISVKGKEKPVRMFAVINFVNSQGPQTLAEMRSLLEIEPPDITQVDINKEEKKYKIGGDA